MDLEAGILPLAKLRGLPMRLAKDWELLETASSTTNRDRWPRAAAWSFRSCVDRSRAPVPVRRSEYAAATALDLAEAA